MDPNPVDPASVSSSETTSEQISVGVIGLGKLAREKLVPAAENNEYLSVVAAADPQFAEVDASDVLDTELDIDAYETHTDMLQDQDLDASIIASPHKFHYDQVKDSRDAGLDVFVEKPMVIDVDEAIDLYTEDVTSDGTLHVGYPRHHHPAYNEMRDWVDSGDIGDIQKVDAYMRQRGWAAHAEGTWRMSKEIAGGGQIYDTGQHALDGLLYATDSTPINVSGEILDKKEGVDVDSTLSLHLEREAASTDEEQSHYFRADVEIGGRPSADNDSTSADYPPSDIEEMLEIYGSTGKVTYDGDRITRWEYDPDTLERLEDMDHDMAEVPDDDLLKDAPAEQQTYDVDDSDLIQREMDNFAAAIRDRYSDNATAEYGMWPVIIAESVYDSASSPEPTIPVASQVPAEPSYTQD